MEVIKVHHTVFTHVTISFSFKKGYIKYVFVNKDDFICENLKSFEF